VLAEIVFAGGELVLTKLEETKANPSLVTNVAKAAYCLVELRDMPVILLAVRLPVL
jgi:hypothetical protein